MQRVFVGSEHMNASAQDRHCPQTDDKPVKRIFSSPDFRHPPRVTEKRKSVFIHPPTLITANYRYCDNISHKVADELLQGADIYSGLFSKKSTVNVSACKLLVTVDFLLQALTFTVDFF